MKDLFDREQKVLEQAFLYLESLSDGGDCEKSKYAELIKEYGRILKLIRSVTRVSDKTAIELHADKIMLLGKVQFDGLTEIYNRRYFDEELHRLFTEGICQQNTLGLLMLDVDFFKLYNDTYGHSMGDECLREIAHTLEESVSEDLGFVARYGGEEFVIVLPGADVDAVQNMAERILKRIKLLNIPHQKNENRGIVTISIGGVCVKPSKNHDEKAYVECADKALYQSKQRGRDCYTLKLFEEGNNDC